MKKVKIKFAGINFNGDKCYVTEKGTYLVYLEDDGYYVLNQAPEFGLDGIDGEPLYKVKSDSLEIVESFNNENNENN